jgi:hypothetical protein
MPKMLALHCRSTFCPTTHRLPDELKNGGIVKDQQFWTWFSSSSAVAIAEACTKFWYISKGKYQGDSDLVNDLVSVSAPAIHLSPNADSLEVISGSLIEMVFGTVMDGPHV